MIPRDFDTIAGLWDEHDDATVADVHGSAPTDRPGGTFGGRFPDEARRLVREMVTRSEAGDDEGARRAWLLVGRILDARPPRRPAVPPSTGTTTPPEAAPVVDLATARARRAR